MHQGKESTDLLAEILMAEGDCGILWGCDSGNIGGTKSGYLQFLEGKKNISKVKQPIQIWQLGENFVEGI